MVVEMGSGETEAGPETAGAWIEAGIRTRYGCQRFVRLRFMDPP